MGILILLKGFPDPKDYQISVASLHLLLLLYSFDSMKKPILDRRLSTALILITLGVVVFLYIWGAQRHSRTLNTDPQQWDQASYLHKAIEMRQTGYQALGNRNQMPLYSVLMSVFYSSKTNPEGFFQTGKTINIVLSLFLLGFVFLLLRRHFPLFDSINLILISAFTVFIFKAPYFQCELLFYFLNFLAFILMIQTLRFPSFSNAMLTGVVGGFAHLTKGSILPGFLIFVGFLLASGALTIKHKIHKNRTALKNPKTFSPVLVGLLSLFAFLIILFPYLHTSKKIFGQYFYNANSTHAMWHDNWGQAKPYMSLYTNPKIKEIPQENLPGPINYLKTHSVGQICHRLGFGALEMILVAMLSTGYFEYMIGYLLFFIILALIYRKKLISEFKKQKSLFAFLTSYFLGYFLLFSFYVPVAPGPRFSLSLFLPYMFTLTAGILILAQGKKFSFRGKSYNLIRCFNIFVFLVVTLDAFNVLSWKLLKYYGGG
ncbi:hypothetical protein BVX98_02605 [bacterium F11]|nr:hypothetical protein BVX98_02605 [bacterium F11]